MNKTRLRAMCAEFFLVKKSRVEMMKCWFECAFICIENMGKLHQEIMKVVGGRDQGGEGQE